MDHTDIAIIGTILFWIGFGIGIAISAKRPRKDPKDISELSEDAMYQAEELIEIFRNLVDSEIDGETGFVFSRNKQTANAKECALIAVQEMERALTRYGKENDELQNMDEEFRQIDRLKKAIERYGI